MNTFFPEIKKNFGFGCMRLPVKDERVDYEEFCKMIDAFLDAGFNYFDTAHCYISGQSETSIRDCLSARHSRDDTEKSDYVAKSLHRWSILRAGTWLAIWQRR